MKQLLALLVVVTLLALIVVGSNIAMQSSRHDDTISGTNDKAVSQIAAIQWKGAKGYRWAELRHPHDRKAGFVQVGSEKTGVTFANDLHAEHVMQNQLRSIGSGVAVGDIDNDGLVDLYFCGLSACNKFYRNLGDWKFEEVTGNPLLACDGQFCTGAVFADLDGDGDLDLLVTALGSPNHCFLNDGMGNFTDATTELGLDSELGGTTLALADIDGDGDIDLYLCNYRSDTMRHFVSRLNLTLDANGKVTGRWKDRILFKDGDVEELGEADVLYRNEGGRFRPVPFNSGSFLDEDGARAEIPRDWSLTARFHDVDLDGDPDLYVCSDFATPDRFWINDGNGRFQAAPRLAMRNMSYASMSVAFADIDRDGHEDFFVSDMLSRRHDLRKRQMGMMRPTPPSIGVIDDRPQIMRNTLFIGRGDNSFAEIAQFAGVDKSDWTWATLFLDVDLDGYEDLLVTTGHGYDVQDADINAEIRSMGKISKEQARRNLVKYPRLEVRNYAFHNQGTLGFREVGEKWGFSRKGITHGIASADLDNDGDLDLVVNNLYAPAGIYRNDCTNPRVAVRLRGQSPNTQGIGAHVELIGQSITQRLQVHAGGIYLSGSDVQLVFASPRDEALQLRARWPSGVVSIIDDVQVNRIYEVLESGADRAGSDQEPESPVPTLFEDVSNLLGHQHYEAPFDDFATQSLLPNRLSQLGPGTSWFDFDDDGDDDLVISSGRGGILAYYRNHEGDRFELAAGGAKLGQLTRDLTTPLGMKVHGKNVCLIGVASYESEETGGNAFEMLDLGDPDQFLPLGGQSVWGSSVGTMAAADVDGDGDLDLFVGGRNVRGKYPLPASSRLFRNEPEGFEEDESNRSVLEHIGLVSGAVFSDVDGDADPDLILALEWGPITVLRNEGGLFVDVTAELGLHTMTGWWNGVTTGDLNGDGRMDIVAVNWGHNSKYDTSPDHGPRVYAADFDKSGSFDIVEAHYDSLSRCLVPERGLSCSSHAMPFVRERLPTFQEYGAAALQHIYGDTTLQNAYRRDATTLSHTVFLNKEEGFVPRVFPPYAQISAGFGVNVADFDGDGLEDVFMAQNFFATQIETNRLDAGRGLLLRGDGKGDLRPVRGHVSGIMVYGEQRGSATSDFDADGRVDLVVTQNGNRTRLFRNVLGRPGLRVRLVGDTGNPHGVGAMIRLQFESEMGPAREIHAGSGYWSQDSSVQVLAGQGEPTGIWVRWPNGKETTTSLTRGATEVMIRTDGTVDTSS